MIKVVLSLYQKLFLHTARFVMKTALLIIALVSLQKFTLFAQNDTIKVSYANKSALSVASIYTRIMWKLTENRDAQKRYLLDVTPYQYASIKTKIDSMIHFSVNPDKITPILIEYGAIAYEAEYKRLYLTTLLIDNAGFYSYPNEVQLHFNKNGYLDYFKCIGFDGGEDMTLEGAILLKKGIKRQSLKDIGL